MFYDELQKRGLDYLLNGNTFKKVLPFYTKELFKHLNKIVKENLKVYIDPDCDCDGYFAALNMKEMFDVIGYSNYIIPCHEFKRHDLNLTHIDNFIYKNPDVKYALLMDSSSNSLDVVDKLNSYGVFVIIIDHHNTKIPREEFHKRNCLIINPRIDSLESGQESLLHDLSAGAISALLVEAYVKINYPDSYRFLEGRHWIYGAITIYSDSCKSNLYNIALLRTVQNTLVKLPPLIEFFMDKYSMFNRSFISFRLVPRINALIRDENFLMVWELFYDLNNFKKKYTIEDIDRIYLASKQFVNTLYEQATIKEYSNIVVAKIGTNVSAKARNYTGLVANKVTNAYKKVCLVIIEHVNGIYEGSVRDLLNRDILELFKSVAIADGHPSAFGISIPIGKLDEVLLNINLMISKFDSNKDTILINWNTYANDQRKIQDDINLMMMYNEYCTHPYPEAYAIVSLNKLTEIKSHGKAVYVKWNGRTIVCPNAYVTNEDILLIKPTIDKQGYKLMGQVYRE